MRQAVIDTNVLVSALLSPNGLPAAVLGALMDNRFQACFDSRILLEYKAVLLRNKFGFDAATVNTLTEYLLRNGMLVNPAAVNIRLPDESDRKFYEVAKHVNAPLVTGNLRHFPQDGIAISVNEFLKSL